MPINFETPPPLQTVPAERRAEIRRRLELTTQDVPNHSLRFPGWLPASRLAYAVALIGVAAAFFAVGAFLFTGFGTSSVGVDSPGFIPASGWNAVSTGTVPMDEGPTAIAANVPLVAEKGPIGTFPEQTLLTLPENGIVFYVIMGSRGELASVDSNYTPTELPIQLSSAQILPIWEGQTAPNEPEYRASVAVGNYNLAVYVYFGTQDPSAAQLTSAQDELNRLEVPSS